ncbi:hypothetical protein ERO13_A08G034300v2 [Gossypium hirsutum]|uniref:Bifunctional inhibitor/plant lipid transfer protein/seed storage helical domain-containing protein n=5 Tax=Gossypium TaxID=3633 RepID=A0ABR0NZI3_GOSAR|nr:hypothetical protein ES319_A08G039400v1 [Gossypium barbadense]KAG4186293.1 hypothetical protein ERO13_A08G034300v2 [Gossypium hirsutum]KAK5810759.1 hypothetical protein PVK06_026076 [Gossypium arboreum]TYI13218.1 hypothetical protein ES332_A08G043600v1 [Gossypium tomentosum]TYJ21112.1 hypothetical protein E1A91_A08G042200v1 [Gossypium mustelinum]
MFRSINSIAMLVFLNFSLDITETAAASPMCNVVIFFLSPCESFIKGGADPAPECCVGAKRLIDQLKAKEDRIEVCQCIKALLPQLGPFDPNRVPLLGQKCGIKNFFPPITPATDCSKV